MGHETAAGTVIRHLQVVKERAEAAGLVARVVQIHQGEPPVLVVINPFVHALSVELVCRPGEDGRRRLCWAWGGPICRADDAETAVAAVRRVIGDLRPPSG